MINLLGCQDVHKCNFEEVHKNCVSIPCLDIENIEEWSELGYLAEFDCQSCESRNYSDSVFGDNPRDPMSASHNIEGLRKSAELQDWLRGDKEKK